MVGELPGHAIAAALKPLARRHRRRPLAEPQPAAAAAGLGQHPRHPRHGAGPRHQRQRAHDAAGRAPGRRLGLHHRRPGIACASRTRPGDQPIPELGALQARTERRRGAGPRAAPPRACPRRGRLAVRRRAGTAGDAADADAFPARSRPSRRNLLERYVRAGRRSDRHGRAAACSRSSSGRAARPRRRRAPARATSPRAAWN